MTFGVFDLKPGLLLDGRSQRVCISGQQNTTHTCVIFNTVCSASIDVQQQQQDAQGGDIKVGLGSDPFLHLPQKPAKKFPAELLLHLRR